MAVNSGQKCTQIAEIGVFCCLLASCRPQNYLYHVEEAQFVGLYVKFSPELASEMNYLHL